MISLNAFFKNAFSFEKVKEDIIRAILFYYPNTDNEYIVYSVDRNSGDSKKNTLSVNEFTILTYRFRHSLLYGTHYSLLVIFGDFSVQNNCFYKTDKCVGRLSYNDDFTMYDIEFFHSNEEYFSYNNI